MMTGKGGGVKDGESMETGGGSGGDDRGKEQEIFVSPACY